MDECHCDAVNDELNAALSDIEEYVYRLVELQSELDEMIKTIADLRALVAEFYGEERSGRVQSEQPGA